MTRGELIGILEQLGDEDTKVYIAIQPNYPLVINIKKTIYVRALDDEEGAIDDGGPAILILAGSDECYGNKDWWNR